MISDSRYFDPQEDKAIVEVGKVLEAVRKHGAYASIVFDEPVTQAVITHAYGGWVRLCSECDAQSFPWEFVRTWTAYFRQRIKRFGHLPGIHEITNSSNGYYEHVPPPILIGDPDKARAVLETRKGNNTMSSKPKVTPGRSGSARVEYYACREEVEALLAQGFNAKNIYDDLKEQGRVTCGYQAFYDHTRKRG